MCEMIIKKRYINEEIFVDEIRDNETYLKILYEVYI